MSEKLNQEKLAGMCEHGNFTGSCELCRQPENQEKSPREIEIKITNIGQPEVLLERILANGGQLIKDRRILRDAGFKLSKEGGQEGLVDLETSEIADLENLESTLSFLGLEIVEKNEGRIKFKSVKNLPERTVRIRQDGESIILTVKEKRKKGAEIDDRIEKEVILPDLAKAEMVLGQIGYQQSSAREKYRTTYKIGNSLVELNEGPVAKPWAEVESESQDQVREIVELLGYKPEDTAAISDTDYYLRQGVPEEKLSHLTFEKNN